MDKKKQKKEQLDDAIENATKLGEVQELQRQLAEVKVEHEDLRNQLKRAVADYHNLEKRVQEGRSELTKWGTGELLVRLLPTLDHLEQALAGAGEGEKQSGWFRGVELAVKELNQVLQSEGLEQIGADPDSIGADGQFDPNLHEALDTQVGEDNKILKVIKKGYTLNGKVLRPAGVIVGKSESRVESQESRQEQEKQEEDTSH
ncbi:nucleotide exchange factor GrpE [Candidatus Daviesbacteria bacterium]|nr:nucleotide exchange factor GrpE [Candidatus Daviesbacteria bacterium]